MAMDQFAIMLNYPFKRVVSPLMITLAPALKETHHTFCVASLSKHTGR